MKYLWIIGIVSVGMLGAGFLLDRAGRGFGPWAGLARLIGGARDLGPVSFPTLVRRATPNDALVCPAGFCRAKADAEAPIFAILARDLRRRLEAVVHGEPRITDLGPGGDFRARLVQRSLVLRFPDIIDAEIIEIDPAHSTLALYSRSAIGISDLGVNRARITRWLDALAHSS
ncbi:MAG TPA: DUF1499 domain-containing protein [Xanthobacteraceae bacterium]|nr:DUF1499 domain-containing protein [Xanthobacteraceae bacterium]